MKKEILIFTGIIVLITHGYALAEDKKNDVARHYDLGKVIVTATKTETCQYEVGSSTTVISAEDIKKTGKGTVQDVLRSVPGISVVRSGPFGGLTSVYLRGSNPGYTLVLIDGIEVNDPIKSDRSFDFSHLTTENIERIEVVRGPQSTLYGSDAVGGVINIITRKGRGDPRFDISSEGGHYNTFKETVGLSGGTKTVNYSVSASRLDTDGISKAAGGSEKDGYYNTAVSSKIGYNISDDAELSLAAHFTDAEIDLDDGSYDDDPNNKAWWRNAAGKIEFDQAVNAVWDHKASFSYSETRRKYKDEPDSRDLSDNTHNWFRSGIKKFEWQNNICPVDWDTLTGGFEYEEERGFGDGHSLDSLGNLKSDRLDRRAVDNQGYYLQNQFKFLESLFITPGLRVDNHELFGAETTYKISNIYNIPETGTRLKANWGTGFKAPSLYQLYHPTYGDSSLMPDESKSYDLGFEHSLSGNKAFFDLTYFHNDFKNMVDWDTVTSKYKNIGKAETKGFETGVRFLPANDLTIGANFYYLDAKDKQTGKKLTKRPENQVNLDINWIFLEKTSLNLGARYNGHTWNNSANTQKVKPYTKVDFSASYEYTKNFQVFGRIENIFDRKYEEARGYAEPGRSFYAGSRVTF